MKLVIVMRKDLGMRTGKMITQGAHAAQAITLENLFSTAWAAPAEPTCDECGGFRMIDVMCDGEPL